MRVLHLMTGLVGGAAKGAYCLHEGLKELGVESKIITDERTSIQDQDIISLSRSKPGYLAVLLRLQLEKLPLYLYRNRGKYIFSTGFSGYDFTKTEAYRWADIIHLHWINAGLVDIRHLAKVKKPIVWTMRDKWAMTGGCHHSSTCERYTEGCGYCEQLSSRFKYDLSRLIVARKRKYLPRHITLVGLSTWLSDCARKSFLFKDYDIRTIYNNIDLQAFFPVDKQTARAALGIRTDKKIILTGSQFLDDVSKGFDKYLSCLTQLDKRDYFLLFFGHSNGLGLEKLEFDHLDLGYLSDVVSLRLAYAAADVFVASSIMEAFGKTLAEAMACGTPVVCFDATGPKEIVDHGETGYKAVPGDSKDLSYGIEWVLNHPEYKELCQRAIIKVKRDFDKSVIAKKYKNLYEELLYHNKII